MCDYNKSDGSLICLKGGGKRGRELAAVLVSSSSIIFMTHVNSDGSF